MKLSRYNRFMNVDGNALGFNCISCGFAEFEPEIYEALKAIESEGVAQEKLGELLPQLIQGGFIIEDEKNELDTLRVLHNVEKYNPNVLSLTIAPTLACNFRCIYCYEEEYSSHKMGDEVQQAIVDFVAKQSSHLELLSICWYGGEPLLAFDVICNLSEQLIKLCAENSIQYSASMISNGWLLDREKAEKLKEYKIESVQVTIDGPREVHNARRPLKGGGGTFDGILKNIEEVYDLFSRVLLRINVDQTNVAHAVEVFELLNNKNLLNKVACYLGKVQADTKACVDFAPCCIDTSSFASMELDIYKTLKSKGFPVDIPYPALLSAFCGVTRLNSFVIDPRGFLYKCWNLTGDEKEAVGNILKPGERNFRDAKWIAIEPFTVAECRECDILPICSAGCPYYYFAGKYEKLGKPDCATWRYSLDEVLLTYYKDWKERALAEQAMQTEQAAQNV